MNEEIQVDERTIPRRALLNLLQELESTDSNRSTLYFPPSGPATVELPSEMRAWLDDHNDFLKRSRNGGVLFWSAAESYLIEAPLPFTDVSLQEGWNTERLRSQISRDYRLGVILLRLGGFAVGVFDGDYLFVSKVGRRFVKNRHRKGGQSQRRYDRIREKQTYEHFGKLCETLEEYLLPEIGSIDYVFRGGDARTMDEFAKQCRSMGKFESKFAPRFLTVPEPRQDVLEALPREIWKCRLWQFTST